MTKINDNPCYGCEKHGSEYCLNECDYSESANKPDMFAILGEVFGKDVEPTEADMKRAEAFMKVDEPVSINDDRIQESIKKIDFKILSKV